MNLLGKILIVLILLMSLAFMSLTVATYSSQKNWREEVMSPRGVSTRPLGLKFQLEDAKNIQEDLKKRYDDVTKSLDKLKAETDVKLQNLDTKLKTAESRADEAEKRLAEQTEVARQAVGANEAGQRNLEAKDAELNAIRDKIAEIRKTSDALFADKVKLTDQLLTAQNDAKRMREEVQKSSEQYAKAVALLRKLHMTPDTPLTDTPPIADGLILAVRSNGMVEISLGSDDGFRKGHQLETFRLSEGVSRYLGRIEVMEIAPNKCVCQILPQFQKGPIQKGDRVASQLK